MVVFELKLTHDSKVGLELRAPPCFGGGCGFEGMTTRRTSISYWKKEFSSAKQSSNVLLLIHKQHSRNQTISCTAAQQVAKFLYL